MNRVKQYLGLLGILVAVAGVALESRWVVWGAVGMLAASVVIRLIAGRRRHPADDAAPGSSAEE